MRNSISVYIMLLLICAIGVMQVGHAQTLATSQPAARIGGKIIDEQGKPVPGAVVCLSNGQEVRADENALFSIETPANSPCMISVEEKGFKPYRKMIQVAGTETLVMVVKLKKDEDKPTDEVN